MRGNLEVTPYPRGTVYRSKCGQPSPEASMAGADMPMSVQARRSRKRRMGSGILTGAGVVLALAVLGSQAAVVAGAAAAVARQKERAAPTVAATPPVKGTWRKTSASSSRSSSSLSQRKQRDAKRSASDSPAPSRTRPPTTFEHLLAGTVGGVSGALVSYPLDTVRVRMQTSEILAGPARTASMLFKEAGIAGFYRGVASPMAGTGLIKAAVFGGYGLCQSLVRKATGEEGEELNLFQLGVAAMGSGFIASFVVTPIERVKVVMQAAVSSSSASFLMEGASKAAAGGGGGGYANAWVCARGLVSEHGVRRGLFAGLGPTMLREVSGYGFYFATYEACKRVLLSREGAGASGGAAMFKTAMSGALAGVAAWLPTYPADVVKSRMQSAGANGDGMLKTASTIWKTEGLAPFYHGLAPTIVRAMVNHAATFLVYEAAMGLMMRDGERREKTRRDSGATIER